MQQEDLRLADLLAALSVVTDLAMGQPPEKAIRACVVATEVARHMGLAEHEVSEAYYTTLLKHLGCTATTHEEVHVFGPDDVGMRAVAERTDVASAPDMLRLLMITGQGTGLRRPLHLARAMAAGKEMNTRIVRAVCEVAAQMSERLGLGEEVRRALYESLERWDGRGGPRGLRGEDIAMPARIAEPATQAVIFHRLGGPEAAMAMVERRSGGWFDPSVAAALRSVGPGILERQDRGDPWEAVLAAEPDPVRRVAPGRLDAVAEAFADLVDLKTPFTLGHSPGVAGVAAAAAERLGMPEPETVRRSALFHDLGRAAVPTGIWEKRGPLNTTEWEQVRLHPYQTERILIRSTALAPLARLAGMHHERMDGGGYHHGSPGPEIPPVARLLAAADAYQAITQERPHRPARSGAEAADEVAAEARRGRLDPDCVRAVVEAAGETPPALPVARPAGLSEREVEVLRLVARGLSNRGIAESLYISPRTAEHHVQHIYAKIGVSTRAGAAMFALEHDLIPR